MKIREIVKSNRKDREADVFVSDGYFNLLCYLHPADKVQVGQIVDVIDSLYCSNIIRSTNREYHIEKKEIYSYELTARVVDRKKQLVKVGDILIYLDAAIPGDIMNDEFISFSVLRLDATISLTPGDTGDK